MNNVLKDYGYNIDWNVGSLFAHDGFIFNLIDICNSCGIKVPIKYAFGSVPCILQGGRIPPRDANDEGALKILDNYMSLGIGCRLTFSNSKIEKDDLKDRKSNMLLGHLNSNSCDVKNGVIVSSDLLADYIKDKYENLEVISSLVKPSVEVGLGRDTLEYYNKLIDIYDVVVVNPYLIRDGKFLTEIKNKNKVEFIANHRCIPNCPRAKSHYEIQSDISRKLINNENADNELKILADINLSCIECRKRNPLQGTSYSHQDIEMLANLGFRNFKIEGRDNNPECFGRDIGDYIFNTSMFTRIMHSILGKAF